MTRNLLTAGRNPDLRDDTHPETTYAAAMHRDDKHPSTTRTGIAGRVEAASKMSPPGPKGKGLVMMLIGVAVLAALVWDFSGRGAASKRVRAAVKDKGEVVTAPSADGSGGTPRKGLELTVTSEGAQLTLGATTAVTFLVSAEGKEEYPEVCDTLLRALAAKDDLVGRTGREAFELASRAIGGTDGDAVGAVDDLTIKAHSALADDTAAPAAIEFLARLPEGIDRLTARALDKVILDRSRPLHIRVAAARARPKSFRPDEVTALTTDANTHPALREALR